MKSAAKALNLCLVVALLLGLPLLGILATGQPIARYLEFPPTTRYVEHAPFSWVASVLLTALILMVVLPFDIRVWLSRRRHGALEGQRPRRPFPWWGWAGVVLSALAWMMAWSRFSWFARFQLFTFSPLWFGYILVVNALTWCRSGRCMLRDRPRYNRALRFGDDPRFYPVAASHLSSPSSQPSPCGRCWLCCSFNPGPPGALGWCGA